jgi:glycosyltransferase involved in cell wall biosynthesis
MRIGILVNTFLPSIGLESGGNVHVLEVARRWAEDEVTAFAPESARADFARALPNARFVAMPDAPPWLSWRLALFFRAIAGIRMRRALRGMDALFASSHFVADVLPAVASKPSRTLVAMHHVLDWRRPGNRISNAVGYLAQALSLVLIKAGIPRVASGTTLAFKQAAWAVRGKRTFLTTNGVTRPPHLISAAESRRGAVYVGRLDKAKRVDDALHAWALLPAPLREGGLHIVGDGALAYRTYLEELARALELSDVRFHGRVDDEEKWTLLDRAALFVFPSGEEGWGIAIAEAMAAGVPCVTYDLPVYDDIFVRGRIAVPLGDVAALARSCAQLLGDSEARARLASDALELGETFTWEHTAQVERGALVFDEPVRTRAARAR